MAVQGSQKTGMGKGAGIIPTAVLCLLIVISETPIVARNIPNIIFYGLVAVFYLSSANLLMRMPRHKLLTLMLLLLYFMMQGTYKLLGISTTSLAYYSTIAKFYFFLTAMIIIGDHLSGNERILITSVISLSVLCTIMDNIRLYFIYGPSRFVHLFQNARFTTNSVSTAFVAGQLFLSGILIICFLQSSRPLARAASVCYAGLNLLFIAVFAQRMILVLLALMMVPLLVMYKIKGNRKRFIIIYAVAVVILLLLVNYEPVLNLASSLVGSERMKLRFQQILLLMKTKDLEQAGGSLSAHFDLIFRSIRAWFSSPQHFLFGVGDHRADNLTIGNHSEYFDECGRYGLLGLCIWVPLTRRYLGEILRLTGAEKGTTLRNQVLVIFVIYILRCFLGSIYEASIGIQMFLMLPLACSLLAGERTALRSAKAVNNEGDQ